MRHYGLPTLVPSPTDPITLASLPNGGWGEPPCGHTAYEDDCPVCMYWVRQDAATRTGIAATARDNTPWLYDRPAPEAMQAVALRRRMAIARRFPGGLPAPPELDEMAPYSPGSLPMLGDGSTSIVVRVPPAASGFRAYSADFDRPRRTPPPPAGKPPGVKKGPGDHLHDMYAAWGLKACAGCLSLMAKMNAWGPAGCRDHLDEIVKDVKSRKNILVLVRKVVKAALSGRVFTSPMPLTVRGQVLEAVRRAEAEQ
jgi:hypothetical protein